MAEPHQRTQSGKLRPASKRTASNNKPLSISKVEIPSVGIENAKDINIGNDNDDDNDDTLKYFAQTPTKLCELQMNILNNIALECGITNDNAIDRNWRNTWNIGAWSIDNQVSVSVNMMQPNISGCWVSVVSNRNDDLHEIINKYSNYPLENATCTITEGSSRYQIKGRWSLHAATELRSLGIIKKEGIEFDSLNVCQSRIFMWMLVGNNSEYLCTLTQQSIVLLTKYIPDYCLDIQEPTEAKNITIRIRNPSKPNDNSQLSVNTSGWLQFNGRIDNIARLYGALAIALRSIMTSIHLKSFLESLHYDVLPKDF